MGIKLSVKAILLKAIILQLDEPTDSVCREQTYFPDVVVDDIMERQKALFFASCRCEEKLNLMNSLVIGVLMFCPMAFNAIVPSVKL